MPKTSHHRSPGGESRGKRKRSTVFLEGARESHRQSDENRNCFKGNIGETSERRGRMHTGLFRAHCSHLELNELNCHQQYDSVSRLAAAMLVIFDSALNHCFWQDGHMDVPASH